MLTAIVECGLVIVVNALVAFDVLTNGDGMRRTVSRSNHRNVGDAR